MSCPFLNFIAAETRETHHFCRSNDQGSQSKQIMADRRPVACHDPIDETTADDDFPLAGAPLQSINIARFAQPYVSPICGM